MAYEKYWEGVAATPFTSNGSKRGEITLASTAGFKVKMNVIITSTTQPTLELEIKRVRSGTLLEVGDRNKAISNRRDISAYLVADNAAITANFQPRQEIPLKDVGRAIFDEEPAVAIRVVQVDQFGDLVGGAGGVASDVNLRDGLGNRITSTTEGLDQCLDVNICNPWDENNRIKVNPVVGEDGVAAGTGTDTTNTQRVSLATNVPLPAGTNNIGDVGSNLEVAGSAVDDSNPVPVGLNVTNIQSFVSTDNSTSTPLGISGTFTGTFEEILGAAAITMIIFSNQDSADDGLIIEWSSDGVNVDEDDKFTIFANRGKQFTFGPPSRYFRVRYINGAIAQTEFRMQVILKPFRGKPSSHRLIDDLNDNDDAELVKAVIAGKDPNGIYINLSTNEQGKLNVISSPTSVPTELADLVIQNVEDGGGSDDLAVDGSVTPVEFTFDADPTDDVFLQEIKFLASQNNIEFDGTQFLGVAGLTNGLLIEITSDGTTTEVANFQLSEDIAAFGSPFLDRGASDFIAVTLALGGNIVLKAGTADNVTVTVRDDLDAAAFKYIKIRVAGIKA